LIKFVDTLMEEFWPVLCRCGPQFSVEHRILSQVTEFARLRGISTFSWNVAEFGTGRR